MKDLARIKLFEAEHFLEDAAARVQREDEYSPSVALGHAFDALILAVDALCQEKNRPTPRRHDENPRVFLELLKAGLIPPDSAQWRDLLTFAASRRAGIQYHAELTSKSEARRIVRQVTGFVAFVRKNLEPL